MSGQKFTMGRPHGLGGGGQLKVTHVPTGEVLYRGTAAKTRRWLDTDCPAPLDEITIENDQ